MPGSYSPTLVAMSVLVAMMASYSALDFAGRVAFSTGRATRLWLVGGALAMGAGIWSMHFIGMLAFSLPVPLAYDLPITLASLLIAVVVSGFALWLVSGAELSARNLVRGGIVMGLGICGMHYTGMAAMLMSPPIDYDPWLFAASVAVAIAASLAALWLAFTLRAAESSRELAMKMLAAAVMGFAIAGMHYTAMAAANFAPGSICRAVGPWSLSGNTLAISIATAIFSVLAVALTASLFDARLARSTARLLESLRDKNRELRDEVERRKEAQRQMQAHAEALEESNRELEQFAYVASHDLQAPLRSLAGFVQLLQRRLGAGLDDKSREYIRYVVESAQQMQQLIEALLALGRVGRQVISRDRVDVNRTLDDVRKMLADVIGTRRAVVTGESLPTVTADPVLLQQVLTNLVSNAIKFQPRNPPEVRVRGEERADGWLLSVADRGIGIDPEYFRKIFQIFQRLHTSDAYQGTGVGLAICDKIVRMHGGRIWVESTPREGSTFFVWLPRPGAAAAPTPGPAPAAARALEAKVAQPARAKA